MTALVSTIPMLAQAPALPWQTATPPANYPVPVPSWPTTPDDQRSNRNPQNTAPQDDRTRMTQYPEMQPERPAAAKSQPDKLTEFQQLVAATTGSQLPIFGASLFGNVPTTFAPVQNIPVTPDYVIGPGDELKLEIWGQLNQQASFVVDRTGSIAVPQVGTVHVAGLKYSQLTEFLRSQLGRIYRNFDLNVNLGQLRSIQVFVVGEARRPGSYTISSLSTLLNALFASGGVLPQGSLRNIEVKRGGSTVVTFDLYDLLLHGDKSKDIPLEPGDVIFIPTVGPQVAVAGSVNNAAIYELHGETTIEQILQLAGGRTSIAAGSHARLERVADHNGRSIVDVDLASTPNTTLQDGDIITVLSIVDKFRNAVTLRGNVANPGRYVWHPGMRITDLIPNKDALITRNYWLKRDALGQSMADYQPQNERNAEGSLQVNGNDSAAAFDNVQQRGSISGQAGGNSAAVALTSRSNVFGAKTDVILSAPDINWSYAVIERQSAVDLTTSLVPFNLGKVVLDGDQGENKELQPGDVVTIFSTSDLRVPTAQQTRFVRLEGEFVAAGVYSVQPGETLRQLLARAQGFTPDAYLYASEFTRESTRRIEQQRLKEYADQLEAQVSTQAANATSRALTPQDAAAAAASSADAQTAISRLRRVQPIGRIVLQLHPDSRSINDLPDLALEDGDRFVVPRVPSNVEVAGQVYSANAFVFERGRHVRDYLRQAGGPNRQADKRRIFVLRADGSVYSDQYGNVAKAKMFPGDTVVVPLQLSHRALLRDLVDVSNIIGQFGIGVAAINVLK